MKTDRRTSRWDAHRTARRAQLVDAAILAIRTHGAGLGMDEVAAAAGTSKTVVYRHFGDRTELYVAVCARVAETLVGQVQAAMDGAGRPRAQAAAGIEAYLRLVEQDREVYRFVMHRPLTLDADPIADLASVVGDRAAAVIAARTGDSVTAMPWGHGIVGLVRAAADNWLARGGRGDVPVMTRAQLAAHLTDLAWVGLSGVVTPSKEQK